jgi:type VI protein secretion system component VasK
MTFRAKPVANKPRRQTRDSYSRRNTYLNIGFGIAVAVAVVILVGVAGVSYYREHLAPAATVGGQTITQDDFKEAAKIEVWRLQQQQARITAAVAAGRLTGPLRSLRVLNRTSLSSVVAAGGRTRRHTRTSRSFARDC